MKKYIVGAVVIIGGAAAFFGFSRNAAAPTEVETATGGVTVPQSESTKDSETSGAMGAAAAKLLYKDGTYTAVGPYKYHGSKDESIFMEITLKDGVIVDSLVTSETDNPVSINMIGRFNGGYKAEVIGKHIDEVALGAVSGSSLTPVGFMAGLETIKAEAAFLLRKVQLGNRFQK